MKLVSLRNFMQHKVEATLDMNTELNSVRCLIHVASPSQPIVFDCRRLSTDMAKKASVILRKYRVTGINESVTGIGGGLDLTLWEDLKLLWENRDYLVIPLAVLRFIKDMRYWIRSRKERLARPMVSIHLSIVLEGPDYPDESIRNALADLKYLADEIEKELSAEYQLFRFMKHIRVSHMPRSLFLEASFAGSVSSLSDARIMKRIARTRLTPETNINLSTNGLGIVAEARYEVRANGFGGEIRPKGPKTKKLYYIS